MTAEVAILNKSAVALAADSLVTVQTVRSMPKTYIVNKLFTLSKYEPIGVMVYGNAQLLGVPWETIIKIFRQHLRDAAFDQVSEYAHAFASFLAANRELFPKEVQEFHFEQAAIASLQSLREEVDRQVNSYTAENGTISRQQINDIANQIVYEQWRRLSDAQELKHLGGAFRERLMHAYRTRLMQLVPEIFANFDLSRDSIQQLCEIPALLYSKDCFPLDGVSGIVVAGFGRREAFPVVTAISVLGIVEDTLVFRDDEGADMNANRPYSHTAAVLPFAQRDVVDAFLQGMDPHFYRLIHEYFRQLLDTWPPLLAEMFGHINDERKRELQDRLSQAAEEALEDFHQRIQNHIQKQHVDPVLAVVEVLPKEELAAMAEAFVNLTSIKRKMSLDVETVGGPIDVAVISKGDGFIWIRRKHYFDPKLNPQFFENYFRV
jgi:hypothetical protein